MRTEEFTDSVELVECKAGDLILWDSRLVHGGRVGSPNKDDEVHQKDSLVR